MNLASATTNTTVDIASIPSDLFIDGQWLPAGSGKRIDVFNPSTEERLATIADASVEDGIAAVDAAARAAKDWARTAPRKRAQILLAAYNLMLEKADWLAELISIENGKALADARGEVIYAAEFFRWYAEEAVRINGDISIAPGGANRIIVQYQPVGVAVLVTPWNFPAAMATRKIGPALAAGCTCILKPATETPLTAFAMVEILMQAGVPKGVVNVITTSSPGPVISAMLHDPRVRKLSFTGSTAVGRRLLAEASDCVINCSMELGGNAPFIVFEDADIDAAVDGAMIAKMRNGGEACTAANRFYVHKAVYHSFAEKLTAKMSAIRVGDGWLPTTDCGPLVNKTSLRKVVDFVDDAVARGAKVLTGGSQLDRKGYFFAPTVLTDVSKDSTLLHDEIFGPVAALVSFESEDEVIELANDTEYGLVSYVYTQNLARGLRVSEQLDAGMVALNRGLVSDPAAPFGGTKQSGLGREGAHHGLLEFTEAKYIATSW
ncbi:NAD-dependent succinate-semialdehyde dehydrogenase [Bosea lathyri]|uniref:Succinate semialdehyde dehydrogenase n=1 Tax=Bosea lathyri TaxID=1036778 RepID=A0A1H6CA26_9HYPH|nr:NAD-dependent succinate-semialdehyde dehydrogenase [Bosea lathyri]SEG69849.1 succinate semialdehyde dehydrogenase [Bosea lathyri]